MSNSPFIERAGVRLDGLPTLVRQPLAKLRLWGQAPGRPGRPDLAVCREKAFALGRLRVILGVAED